MGCVSSKQLKKQALLEEQWSETPPSKRKLFDKPSNSELSFEHYHYHNVALTSSSYGVLKVDTPKTAADIKKSAARVGSMDDMYAKLNLGESMDSAPHPDIKKSTARAGSMNDLYEKLNLAESMDSAPESWHEVGSILQTLKPGLQRSISIPVPHSSRPSVRETINVSDIMQGLEEGASVSLSPSQYATTNSLQPPPPPPVPERSCIRRLNKHTTFTSCQGMNFHSEPHFNAGLVEKFPVFPSESISVFSTHSAEHLPHRFKYPSFAEHLPLNMQTRMNGTCCQDQHVLTKTMSISNQSMKSLVEDRSLCEASKPPSGTLYSTSSRKVKVTLNVEHERTLITDMPMGQDVCISAGLSARRSIADALTEPDSPLFDPALIASYERALQEVRKEDWTIADNTTDLYEKKRLTKETDMDVDASPTLPILEDCQSDPVETLDVAITPSLVVESVNPLNEFDWICPPGGEETGVLYTTTLRGIFKTFEDCNNIRDILKGFSVGFHERDISMHATYRNELKELLGGQVSVPSLFIKGRYIGRADDVRRLHEEGKLYVLLKGLPSDLNAGVCDGCGDIRFIPCLECSGSCRIVDQNSVSRCPECNENGLIQCPICSRA